MLAFPMRKLFSQFDKTQTDKHNLHGFTIHIVSRQTQSKAQRNSEGEKLIDI